MKTFIGCKLIKAKPMTLGEYNKHRGWEIPKDEDPARPGYLVEYPDGYQSWSPKEAFEDAYLELENETKISFEDIERFIGDAEVAFTAVQHDPKTTLVGMNPRTGYVQYEFSSCVAPENYDHELGAKIASERIVNRIWPHLGFVLQWAKYGLNGNQA